MESMELTESSRPGAATSQNNKSIVFHSVKLPLSPLLQESPPSTSPKLPSPQVPSFCFNRERTPPPKPLLDIEVVRAFIRAKLSPPKDFSSHSAAKRVPSGVFGIGTMGSAGSDGGYVHLSSSEANEHQGQISSHPPFHDHSQNANGQLHPKDQCGDSHHHNYEHAQNGFVQKDRATQDDDRGPQSGNEGSNGCSYHNCESTPHHQHSQPPYPLLDIDDVRDALDSFLHYTGLRRHPTTSWLNKMPWHVPRAPFLAKGLEWPPESFESEEARRAYYRKARKRKPFLLGSPPLWTVTALNLAFIQLLMYNPLQRFFNYLRRLP